MKYIVALFVLGLAVAPASAADSAYVDASGCIHTPVLLKSGEAGYWNLDTDTCDGDLFTSIGSRYPTDDQQTERELIDRRRANAEKNQAG